MEVPRNARPSKYDDRPPPCLDCAGPSWWDGKRTVGAVRQGGAGPEYGQEVRRRAKCPSPHCPRGSWTVYERDAYPHRGFSLEVVASAVSEVAVGGHSQEDSAQRHGCSRRSVGRWRRWVEALAEPAELMRSCTRLTSNGLPGGTAVERRAGAVLHLLDRLAELLVERGMRLPHFSCGLVRLLVDQLRRLGAVFWLTKSSPPLHADLSVVVL
jgi:transposase-like protein